MTKRAARLIASTLLAWAPLQALACPALPAEAEAQVRQAAAALDTAIRRGDRAVLESKVAPDFQQVLGNGERVTRAGFIDALSAAAGGTGTFSVERLQACGWGDTAVVTFDAIFTVHDGTATRTVSTFIADVYRRDTRGLGPSWLLAFEQIGVRR